MPFKINDYVKHVEKPKSAPIPLVQQWHVDVVNAQAEKYEQSSKEEYNEWWEGEK